MAEHKIVHDVFREIILKHLSDREYLNYTPLKRI